MRLLVDLMCGGVVSYLRMCGHETAYAGDRELEADDDLLRVAQAETRTLVSRDVALAARADEGILLESTAVEDQLVELCVAGVELRLADPPARCGRCNGRLDRVGADETTAPYAPEPADFDVWRCRRCDQLFWKGSHWERVRETLERVRRASRGKRRTGEDEPIGESQ